MPAIVAAAVPIAKSAMPVEVHGFSWSAALLVIANLLIGGVLVNIVRTRPQIKKIANDREANLLTERAEDMEAMRSRVEKLENRLENKDIQHEAERAYDRHRINNLATALNSFFMLVKRNPNDAAAAAEMIEDLRAQQVSAENLENIALRKLIAGLSHPVEKDGAA